jgi:LysM domain
MMEVDMVAMATEIPVSAMDEERSAAGGASVRTIIAWPIPARIQSATPAARPPVPSAVRLTPRGRIVVTAASALLIGALSVLLATAAQATRSGSVTPGGHVAKVAVRPGQSLWSLAEAYDPNSDPRVIVQQIQQLNSLTGDELQPGRLLWVPRG